jgi:hypothetical protein
MYENLTFRQLLDLVARHGLDVDERPRLITKMARDWRVSRTHLYNMLKGLKEASPMMIADVTKGMKKIAPWITKEIVEAAINRTRLLQELRV